MSQIRFTDRSGSYGPGSREHSRGADGLTKILLEKVAAAEAIIGASPSGVEATYIEFAESLGWMPGLPNFLSAISSDTPAAIAAASEISDSYCRLVAILIVMAKLRGC